MVSYLLNLKGNPKYCIFTEPLWFIPYSLFSPFATLYMSHLGVSDSQIGYIITIGMIIQVFASFFGGVLTDKFGRRMTTFIADLVSWSLPCLIWVFAQNFWWFFVAIIFNSIWQVSNISWGSLLVEDSEPSGLVYAYSWIQIASVLSVFFAPISYLLMKNNDFVFVVRCLYAFSFVSMTIKFLILFTQGSETAQGRKRMEETKNTPISEMMKGYKSVFLKLIKSREMVIALCIMLSYNITNTVYANFFGLYTTNDLGVDTGMLAIFSMVGACITLVFMFTIQTKLNKAKFKIVMLTGYILFIANNIMLVLAPEGQIGFVYVYSIINAMAVAFVAPRKDSMAAVFVDKQDRARVLAIMYMIMIGITAPFGTLMGFLSEIDRSYPFVLSITVFILTAIIVIFSKEITKLDKKRREELN